MPELSWFLHWRGREGESVPELSGDADRLPDPRSWAIASRGRLKTGGRWCVSRFLSATFGRRGLKSSLRSSGLHDTRKPQVGYIARRYVLSVDRVRMMDGACLACSLKLRRVSRGVVRNAYK